MLALLLYRGGGGKTPAGRHRKRYGVRDGWRLLIFDTPQQAKVAQEIIDARAVALPTKRIKIRAAKPLPAAQRIELKPLEQFVARQDRWSEYLSALQESRYEALLQLQRDMEEDDITSILLLM